MTTNGEKTFEPRDSVMLKSEGRRASEPLADRNPTGRFCD
jgi:hypothetical protein